MIEKDTIISLGKQAGAEVIGIASAADFTLAPPGFSPTDKLKSCRAVIVLGCPFPKEALSKSTEEYTVIRNSMVDKLNEIAETLAKKIKETGHKTKAIKGLGGKWDNGRFRGTISLKHAAELAGLGVITRNYLLTNQQYGNLLWFSAVLTDAEIEASTPLKNNKLCKKCNKCQENCPAGALDDPELFSQKQCYSVCYKTVKGKPELKCFECRKVCPYRFGFPLES